MMICSSNVNARSKSRLRSSSEINDIAGYEQITPHIPEVLSLNDPGYGQEDLHHLAHLVQAKVNNAALP
jgi:hypothetical protein